jgi:RNA polymerase sigma-70 factor (ECF subfamily)
MKNEKVILEQLITGSHKAFTQIYNQYFDLLYGFVFKLLHSHAMAAEIVQDVFIKVWENRAKIDPNGAFKSWIFKIAKNDLIDLLRVQMNNPLFEDYLNYCNNENITISQDNSFDFDQFMTALTTAKIKLSPRQAQVFELCKEEGLSAKIVSKQLNISEQAVYNYLSQSIHFLRNELKHFLHFLIFFIQ